MELKRVLNPADDTAEHPPQKRQSQSPSSTRLPSSPDVYETSSLPGSASVLDMGQMYSYFDNQSSSSAASSPPLGAQDIQKSDDDGGNYTYQQGGNAAEEPPYDASPDINLDPQLGGVPLNDDFLFAIDHPQDDSLPTAALPDDPPAYDTLNTLNGSPPTVSSLTNTNTSTRLTDLSLPEREQYYTNLWSNMDIDLKDLTLPNLYHQYPQLADEMLTAYFYHITVNVKIWSNYDSPTGQFFFYPFNRLADCGKIYLTPKQRRRLDALGPFQLMNVRFEIGTPFRTLFRVLVSTRLNENLEACGLDARGFQVEDPHQPHDALRELVKGAVGNIRADGLAEGVVGLGLKDLDEIAKDFVLKESKVKVKPRFDRSHWFH
ncbi:hypothetical protein PRZ48_010944 [Zasmidium cellare]|uniref:Uncharacterized protein n=1 Tax=Zasmidium cellare TaxID=395010 RepID=A0ABR0EA37_ZASCE|nr:hypothetical protein PRZ48_010944 [Zasmidium cellare]